jgi:hypothetical protein
VLQIHPDKKMTFRALNEVDYRDWKDLIQNAIAHAVSKGPDPNNNRDRKYQFQLELIKITPNTSKKKFLRNFINFICRNIAALAIKEQTTR